MSKAKKRRASPKNVPLRATRARYARAAREDAAAAGLLDGRRTAQVSVRTTPALLEAAKRRTGVVSNTELVELALAALASPDPVAAFLKANYGALGPDHTLEF